ncbi:MAG TPA: indolepyruvate oxidoreductase subunit beta [Candidatus Polarisedimenticolaceae bacterium]|nr:indolepyruvate oxidoreductase subunit beta [Candidatus Polarisedimenticolaceae bacterium]
MKTDIVLAGVGGQGVLSIAAVIGACALEEGYAVKQSEVHGMAQRGASVYAHLRIADRPIASPLIGQGTADLLLSMEPMEVFRYLGLLAPGGKVVTAIEPVPNVTGYLPIAEVLDAVRAIPGALLVDTEGLARLAGTPRVANVVLVGAVSDLLPIRAQAFEAHLRRAFAAKGPKVVEANLAAFRLGREAAMAPVSA